MKQAIECRLKEPGGFECVDQELGVPGPDGLTWVPADANGKALFVDAIRAQQLRGTDAQRLGRADRQGQLRNRAVDGDRAMIEAMQGLK